ncbi:MAG: site-specific integrase [Actinobacteria bacterium]|nr:site-specific integrase [Actinomycetota bacterium]
MSVHNIGPNKWEVSVELGTDPSTGKRVRPRLIYNGTKSGAEAYEVKIRTGGQAEVKTDTRVTVKAFLEDQWLPSLELEGNSLEYYSNGVKTDIVPRIGYTRLADLNVENLEAFFRKMPMNTTRKRAKKTLSAALSYAVKCRKIPYNPIRDVDIKMPPKADKKAAYSTDEVRTLREHFFGHRIEAAFLLGVYCGLRKEEILALDWHTSLDLKAGIVHVRSAYCLVKGKPEIKRTKTDKIREVPISGYALDRLNVLGDDRIGCVVVGLKGGRMNPKYLHDAFQDEVAKAGVRYIPVGMVRHTFATRSLEAGVSPAVVASIMGHMTTQMLDNYVRPLEEEKQGACKRLAELYDGGEVDEAEPGGAGESSQNPPKLADEMRITCVEIAKTS